MKLRTLMISAAAVLLSNACFAYSIDYVASSISPAASFNGVSGNFTVVNPVAPGATIAFTLTYSVSTNGSTTVFPRTVTFGTAGNEPAAVSGLASCTFLSASTRCSNNVVIVAPATPGSYNVKIQATSGTGGGVGLGGGGGIVIGFTVAQPVVVPTIQPTRLDLTQIGNGGCALYRQPAVNAVANLTTTAGSPVAYRTVTFKVNEQPVGSAVTDANGDAKLDLNAGLLSIGDHTVSAAFAGDSQYGPSGDNANLGLTYVFAGFQQPINGDGSSVFSGRVAPVKVRIRDFYTSPVTDAAAHVFFAFGTPVIVGTDAEALANTSSDLGNRMRYDLTADQYIFNWDLNNLAAGTYTVRVDLAEGRCGSAHSAIVSLGKKK
jgi:hypothetical protein